MDVAQQASGDGVGLPLEAAHRRLLADPGLQFDFTTIAPPRPPGWLDWVARALEALAPALKYVFWGGVAAGALLIVFLVGRELAGVRLRRRRAAEPPPEAAWRPEATVARALLEEADRLAAAGRYEEAAHLLLFRSIEDLAQREPALVKPALTSRDIAALQVLPASARQAFERIARAVETSFFGGRRLDAAGFADCRRAYEAFAFAEGWR